MIEKAFNWTLGMGDRGGAFDSLQWSKASQDGGYKVHAFADGGIVNGATFGLLGEAGSEAVVPLDSFQDVVSTIAELNDTMQKFLYGSGGGSSGGYGGSRGLSDTSGAVYEQYPWEGHAANYGAYRGMKLHDDGREIGLGTYWQGQGHPLGSWVKVKMQDGTEYTRQVQETSERNHGVEFFSDKAGKYNRHGKAMSVENASPPITYAPTYHINVLDSSGMSQILDTHGAQIHKHLKSIQADEWSKSAVV